MAEGGAAVEGGAAAEGEAAVCVPGAAGAEGVDKSRHPIETPKKSERKE